MAVGGAMDLSLHLSPRPPSLLISFARLSVPPLDECDVPAGEGRWMTDTSRRGGQLTG